MVIGHFLEGPCFMGRGSRSLPSAATRREYQADMVLVRYLADLDDVILTSLGKRDEKQGAGHGYSTQTLLMRDALLFTVAVLLYLIGTTWVILFPAATVSQGKLGCRETFISENALPKLYQPLVLTPGGKSRASRLFQHLSNITVDGREEHGGALARPTWAQFALAASVRGSGRMANQESIVVAACHSGPLTGKLLPYSPIFAAFRAVDLVANTAWLSKDLVVVIVLSEDCGRGMEGWAAQALDDPSATASPPSPHSKPALIRGAVVLEWNSTLVESGTFDLGVLVPGPWNRLPDLDLATLVMRRSQIPVAISNSQQNCLLAQDSYAFNLVGLLDFMTAVGLGPYRPHSAFLTRNIDSLTLTAVPRCSATQATAFASHDDLVASSEIFVNAVSMMEEKLHASFYFYFLLSPTRFVSFGEYFGAFGAVLIGPALCCVLALGPRKAPLLRGVGSFVTQAAGIMGYGAAILGAVPLLTDNHRATMIGLGLLLGFPFLGVALLKRESDSGEGLIMTTVLLTLPLIPYSMLNFPVALFVSSATMPVLFVTCWAVKYPSTISRWTQRLLCFVLSPSAVILALELVRLPSPQLAVLANPFSQHGAVLAFIWVPVHSLLVLSASSAPKLKQS